MLTIFRTSILKKKAVYNDLLFVIHIIGPCPQLIKNYDRHIFILYTSYLGLTTRSYGGGGK